MDVRLRDSNGTILRIEDSPAFAARVIEYDAKGYPLRGAVRYQASCLDAIATENGDAGVWFAMQGSASKLVKVQRIVVSGLTMTAVAYHTILAGKYSTAPADGTPTTAFVQTPLDSDDDAGTLDLIQGYTAAPTIGTLVGNLASRRILVQATTAAAAGQPVPVADFDWRESGGVILRGVLEGVALKWAGAPGSALSLAVCAEWTEEDEVA